MPALLSRLGGATPGYWRTVAGFSRDVRLYIAVSAAVGFAYFGVVSTLLNLYVLRLGFEPQFVGVMTGAGQLAGVACALPAAALARRIGPRNGIIVALALVGASIALMLYVQSLPQAVWAAWLIGASIAFWIGVVLFGSSAQPYLMGVARASERTHAFAVRQMALALMAVAGSFVAGLLPSLYATRRGLTPDDAEPYRVALWVAVLGLALGAALAMLARPTAPESDDFAPTHAGGPPLGFLLGFGLVAFLGAACVGTRLFFFNVYLDAGLHVPVARIGLTMGLGGLLGAFAPLAAPPLVSRLGLARVIVLASGGMGLSMALMGAIPNFGAAVVSYIGAVAGAALIEPTRMMFGLEGVTARWRTGAASLATVGALGGWAFASLAGGRLIPLRGFAGLFYLGAAMGLAAGGAILLLARRGRSGGSLT